MKKKWEHKIKKSCAQVVNKIANKNYEEKLWILSATQIYTEIVNICYARWAKFVNKIFEKSQPKVVNKIVNKNCEQMLVGLVGGWLRKAGNKA